MGTPYLFSMQDRLTWFRRLLVLTFSLVLLGLGLAAPAQALTEEQRFVNEVWRIVDRAYVDASFNHQNWWAIRQKALRQPMETQEAAYTVVQEMLTSLDDPFTRLLKPDQYRSLQTSTSGELTGVGLQIALEPDTKKLVVIAPIEGSPAARSGIRPADRILMIDGTPTEGLSLDEAAERMRGMIGTRVLLKIERDGEAVSDVELIRDRIALNPVYAEARPRPDGSSIGYLRLSQFNANATAELAHAIHRLEKQGVSGYVLDLRNNPGGLLQAGIEVARLWIDQGTIVYTVNRQGTVGSFEAIDQALTRAPLVVLVNQGTASASEILAGALQDNHRATIVGEKTFGKGLIQSLFDLPDGAGLAVTVARYETPSHRDINKQGIVPDRVVSLDPITFDQVGTEADRQYQAAIDALSTHSQLAKAA